MCVQIKHKTAKLFAILICLIVGDFQGFSPDSLAKRSSHARSGISNHRRPQHMYVGARQCLVSGFLMRTKKKSFYWSSSWWLNFNTTLTLGYWAAAKLWDLQDKRRKALIEAGVELRRQNCSSVRKTLKKRNKKCNKNKMQLLNSRNSMSITHKDNWKHGHLFTDINSPFYYLLL